MFILKKYDRLLSETFISYEYIYEGLQKGKFTNKNFNFVRKGEVNMNDDNQLILLIKNNPHEGLSKIIDLYGGTVKWIVLKILGSCNSQDIEECVSDIFVKLWKNIDNFNADNNISLKSYLYGISRHTAIDYLRKTKSHIDVVPIEENDIGFSIDFADQLAKETNSRILQEAVEALPEPDRKIFILRYYFQERVNSIAESLSLSPKTIENKLYRGKKVLREALIERGIII